jgi:hypothetical protein
MWISLISVKSNTTSAIKQVKAATEMEVGRPL